MDYGAGANATHSNVKSAASKQKRVKFILNGSPKSRDFSDTTPSSTSSDSSSDDLYHVNPQTLPKFRVENTPPHSNAAPSKPFYEIDETDVSSEALYRLEESTDGSPESTSQFSDITQESLLPIFSPTQSPPIQVMERPEGFDPNRIPISVFSKSSTPTDWSIASNDSLFSIRIGNTSFSRDHVSRIDLDLPKSNSGELFHSEESEETYKSSELFESSEDFKAGDLKMSGELIRLRPTSPSFKGLEPYFSIEKTIIEDVRIEEMRKVDEPINDGSKCPMKKEVDITAYRQSDKNEKNRVEPCPKPKKKKSSCLLCNCHGCSCEWLTCSCKWLRWPSCSFKWCIWPSCSKNCFKCPNLSSCCCKCPSWSCCKCSSWSCCKCSSWSCCKCSSWSCCKCSSWSCWNSCKCQCSNCTLSCCYCWNSEGKSSSDSSVIVADGERTNSKSSTKASSEEKCTCFSCSSSCCSCCSFSCCC